MNLIEFLEKVGCENIQSGSNDKAKATMMNGRVVVTASVQNGKFQVTATDTTRNPEKELSYVKCRKNVKEASLKTINDFQYRINQLVSRNYEDRDKIIIAKNAEVGKEYYTIDDYNDTSQVSLVKITDISEADIRCKVLKICKDFTDFFELEELDDEFSLEPDCWLIDPKEGLYCKDMQWNLIKLPDSMLLDIDQFKIRFKLHEGVRKIWRETVGENAELYDNDISVILAGGPDNIFEILEDIYHDPKLTSNLTGKAIAIYVAVRNLKTEFDIPVEDSWYL